MSLYVDITCTRGSFTLRVQIDSADPSQVMALLGSSGCGKSLTLKCIAGLETPDSGIIRLDEHVWFDSTRNINVAPQKRRVGYLFQDFALFPTMSVKDNILAALYGHPRAYQLQRLAQSLKDFALEDLKDHLPSQLSGGQKQRVALARMFAADPAIILLDEPFSAIDSYLRAQLEIELLDRLQTYPGHVLYVSHNRDEVFRLCQHVCVLENGVSAPIRSVREIFSQPHTRAAAQISGCKNISRLEPYDATTHDVPFAQVSSSDGETLPLVWCETWNIVLQVSKMPGKARAVGIRAHDIEVLSYGSKNHTTDVSGYKRPNVFLAHVRYRLDNVFSERLILTIGNGGYLHCECAADTLEALAPGDVVVIALDPDKIMLLEDDFYAR